MKGHCWWEGEKEGGRPRRSHTRKHVADLGGQVERSGRVQKLDNESQNLGVGQVILCFGEHLSAVFFEHDLDFVAATLGGPVFQGPKLLAVLLIELGLSAHVGRELAESVELDGAARRFTRAVVLALEI